MGLVTTTLEKPAAAPESPVVRDRADVRRQIKLVVVMALVAAALLYFATSIENATVQYVLGDRVSAEFPPHDLSAAPVVWTAFAVSLVSLALAVLNRLRGWLGVTAFLVTGLAFYAGFIVWAYSDQSEGFQASIANPLPGTIEIATPLILGALAGVMCERAGVINIAIEGQFLVGAFFAAVLASLAFSAYLGLVGAVLAGVGLAALLAVFSLKLPGQPGGPRRRADRAGVRSDGVPAQPDPERPEHPPVPQRAAAPPGAADPGALRLADHRAGAVQPDAAGLPDVHLGRPP